MKSTPFAWAIAVALAISPAYAVQAKKGKTAAHKVAHKRSAHAQQTIEDEAWGGSGTKAKKPVQKKAVAKKASGAPTVQLNTAPKTPVATAKPIDKPTVQTQPDPTKPAAATDNTTKSAEELEKQAQTMRDPRQALATYNKLVQGNPNYAYAGDVYANMYNLSVRSHGDTLDQLKYAGMAAEKMQAGLTRQPATQQQINHFKTLEENLTNKWIQDEIQKIMAGKE